MEALRSDGYMFAIVDRGADALLAGGRITLQLADALKAEARRRSKTRASSWTHGVRKPHSAEIRLNFSGESAAQRSAADALWIEPRTLRELGAARSPTSELSELPAERGARGRPGD